MSLLACREMIDRRSMSVRHNRINSKMKYIEERKEMSTLIKDLMRKKNEEEKCRDECQPNQFHLYVILRFFSSSVASPIYVLLLLL